MLLTLTLLFMHYGPLLYWAVYVKDFDHSESPLYLQLSPVYEAFSELGLAFGMLLLATERVRAELEEKNRQLAEATAQLAIAARTDVLTGLYNRRGYEELLADKAGRPFIGSLVMIDLNNLKPLNDTHGHEAGDAALQLVARALRGSFRVTDPIYRLGGDEFLVVLPGGSSSDATTRMERIDRVLLGQRLPNVTGTVDLGIAWGVADFTSGDELPVAVGKADHAMLTRKPGRGSKASGQ
jgi:diguanylate cyclase (GGDEF)-like protein